MATKPLQKNSMLKTLQKKKRVNYMYQASPEVCMIGLRKNIGIFIIYLPVSSVLYLSFFSPVRHSDVAEHCYMMFYRQGNNNQTDQEDETEGLEREGFEIYGLEIEV